MSRIQNADPGSLGVLLEIGKKDIVDRNGLAMEPFDRNCSYHGIDISRQSILNDLPLVDRVLQQIRGLLLSGHIQPISPVTVFPFSKIPDAMRYMRSGEHMGKIVICNGDEDDVMVPIRRVPYTVTFDPDATYLIVGGLKGLCGSLAIYMARCGAKSLTIMSRSGADDETSRRVIQDLNSLGTTTRIVCGDVSNLEDVDRMFSELTSPIKGVIQGAMLLRVSATSKGYMSMAKLTDILISGQDHRIDDATRISGSPCMQGIGHLEYSSYSGADMFQARLLHHAVLHFRNSRHFGPGQLCCRKYFPRCLCALSTITWPCSTRSQPRNRRRCGLPQQQPRAS